MKPTSLQHLATLVSGTVIGDEQTLISEAQPLDIAKRGAITFLENESRAGLLNSCNASAVVVPPNIPANGIPCIQVSEPLSAFVQIVRYFQGDSDNRERSIDPRAAIHHSARLGENCSIGPFAHIAAGCVLGNGCIIHPGVSISENCRLGNDVVLHPNVVLYPNTVIHDRSVIHANSVIGADGFGYRFKNGRHEKVPQLGNVEIGEDVEIGSCSTVDRGTFQATRIGDGCKFDNLVQVGHNCQIGNHNLFISQMGMGGSSSTGDYVIIAGQVGICDHVHLGTGAIIGAQAGVTKEVPDGQRMLGSPATPERDQKRILMSLEKLPDIRKDLKRIKKHIGLEDAA